MSLRTLAARFRQRDWLSVGIEVLIVVAGVFIGLQVSDWNDERKSTELGRAYLQRMHDELLVDVGELRHISAFWERVMAYGEVALAHAETGVVPQGSAWKTLLAYYQASQVWPYRKPDITFQEIRSSGDLRLIRNAALRARIAKHYSASAGSQVVEVLGLIPPYREHVRGLTPWALQKYIWSNCYRAEDTDQRLLDCPAPVSEAEALAVLEQYRNSPRLTEELRFWMVNLHNGLVLMSGIRSEAEALAGDLSREAAR